MSETAIQKVEPKKAITQFKGAKTSEVNELFDRYKPQIAQALPKHLTPERMIAMVTHMVTQNPAIAECTIPSVIGAMMQASILGFQPVPALGECYFVPYGKNCTFQIGYKGLIRLAQRSGELKMIDAHVVRKGDEFTYEYGLNPTMSHKPLEGNTADITHSYAVAHYKNGGYNFVVLSFNQIEKLRMRNASQKNRINGAWDTDYDKMAMAKALKQLSPYLPLSPEIITAIASDESVIIPESFSNGQLLPENINYDTGEMSDMSASGISDEKEREMLRNFAANCEMESELEKQRSVFEKYNMVDILNERIQELIRP